MELVKYDFIFGIVLFAISCISLLCIWCAVNEYKERRRDKRLAQNKSEIDRMKASDGDLKNEGNEFTVKLQPMIIGQKTNTNENDAPKVKKISALDLSKVLSQSCCNSNDYVDEDADEKNEDCTSTVSVCRTTVVEDFKIVRHHS